MSQTPPNRLDSWKEIADYLGREVRTVIRWEKDRAMPVHRVPGGRRNAVFAYREELDAWLRGLPAEAGQPAASFSESQPLNAIEAVSHIEHSAELAIPAFQGWLRHWTAPWLAMSLVLGLAILVIPRFSSTRAGPPVRITLANDRLYAWDAAGKQAWSYRFSGPVETLSETLHPYQFTDLDGDNQGELIAAVAFTSQEGQIRPRTAVFCFSTQGKLLWQYEPQMTLSFGGKDFTGPWIVRDVLVSPESSKKSVWVAFSHHTWWPGFVVKLDATGYAAMQFVNSGHITSLSYIRNARGGFLLAAALNNEYDGAAALAVIPEDQPFAASPQGPSTPYWCDHCSEDRPFRYFVFPRSELNRLAGLSFNQIRLIQLDGPRITVQTEELPPAGGHIAGGLYSLSREFEIESSSYTDTYWSQHLELEQAGRLSHSVANCPESKRALRTRMWDHARGWIQPPIVVAGLKN